MAKTTTEKRKGPGRPPLNRKKRKKFPFSMNAEERGMVQEAANLDKDPAATWTRKRVLEAAEARIEKDEAEKAAKEAAKAKKKAPK